MTGADIQAMSGDLLENLRALAGAFGMMGAAWGLGFVLGPAFGGVLGAMGAQRTNWIESTEGATVKRTETGIL